MWFRRYPIATAFASAALFVLAGSTAARAGTEALTATGHFGLFPADQFVVSTAAQAPIAQSTRWYFGDEYIAARASAMSAQDYTAGMRPFADVRAWAKAYDPDALQPPALVWLGATGYATGAQLSADARSVTLHGVATPLGLAPRLPLNRSYFDATSAAYLAQRTLTVRGEMRDGGFVAHTLWPEDFALAMHAPVTPLGADIATSLALRGLVRATADGGAREPFLQRRLWSRTPEATATTVAATPAAAPPDPAPTNALGRPVLVVMVNGAQGDDDESWGGHFALGTGTLGPGGHLGDVMINNFYSLDVVSEKGILAGPTPLDHYLADLNSGQAWYRPSYLIVATLRDPRAALMIQGALNRVIAQFWRHQLVYEHATMNCASISVDTLRALGWKIHARGASSRVLGWLGMPYALFKYGSVTQARMAYEYMTEDQTRLFPQAAFEEIGSSLLHLATHGAQPEDGALAQMLAQDVLALDYVQVPQLPSSRKFGGWAVVTPAEYYGKVPRDPANAQIVPVPPRVFPDDLRDADLLRPPPRRSDFPLVVWTGFAAALLGVAVRFALRLLR